MALLSKEDIFRAEDRKTEDVDVPEWGGTIRLRTISGRERDAFEASMLAQGAKTPAERLQNFRARMVALCAVDEAGKPLFTQEDIEILGTKNAGVLDRLLDVCNNLNAIAPKQVEALEKNFDASQVDASPST